MSRKLSLTKSPCYEGMYEERRRRLPGYPSNRRWLCSNGRIQLNTLELECCLPPRGTSGPSAIARTIRGFCLGKEFQLSQLNVGLTVESMQAMKFYKGSVRWVKHRSAAFQLTSVMREVVKPHDAGCSS
jgi:hypothetical protein